MVSSITEAPNTSITAVTAYEYDSRANVNKVTDPLGRVTKYFYDTLDRLTSVIGPDSDGAGPLISPMVRYDYNVYGRLIATEVINSTIDSTGALFVTSLVDGNSYDNFQRLTGEFQQKGETIWYVTGISATGVTRSLSPAAPTSIDLQALAAANTRISTSSVANSTVTPVTDTTNQGLVKKYQYDKNHNMVSVEVSNAGADARITKVTYDRANRPVMVVTPNPGGSEAQNVAGEIRNTNSAAGEIGGYVSTTIFDNINQTWRTTDTQGTAINYRYDDLGRTKSVTVPGPTTGAAALTTQYSYTSVNKTGWLVQQTDPNSHIASVQYDYRGIVIKATAPDGGVMGATYYGDGQVRRPVMSAEPNTEVRVGYADYDVRGRRTILSDLYGETSFNYRLDGSLNSVTDPLSRTTSFTYDAAGRMTKQTSPDSDGAGPLLSASGYRSYDSLGNVLNSHNDTSLGTTLAYDGRFRALSSTDSDGAATSFTYDAYGQRTQVEDAKQNKTTFDYDRLNRQFKETKIGYGSRTTTLDGVGNVQNYLDRNGRTTLYEYNKLYDVTKETWVNPVGVNTVTTYEYDATGRLVSVWDYNANGNDFTYDINDRVDTERVFIAGFTAYVGEVKLDNDFNQRGLRTRVSTSIGITADAVNDYTYDNRNMMTSVKQSGANVTDKLVNFTYNVTGQLNTINRFKTLTPQSLVASSKYQYDGAGRVQGITHSKTAASTAWNGTDVSTATDDPILAAYFLKYDQSNRVTSFASRFDGFSTAYTYDTRDQLTGATTTPLAGATVTFTPPVENYSFDPTGNRTNGGTSTSANETHNRVQNDGTNTYQYDNEGNQISRTNNSTGEVTTYSYDFRNRLVKVASPGKVVSYQYDAFDRRTRKLVDDGGNGSIESKTAWVWDGNQVIFQFKDFDGDGGLPYKLTNRYLYGDIVDLILADEQVGVPGTSGSGGSVGNPMGYPTGSTGSSGSVSTEGLYRILWPLSDQLGTVRDLIDSDGTRLEHRVYDSFGKLLLEDEDFSGSTGGSVGMPSGGGTNTDAIDSLFGYAGREWDKDVKLQFNRARWYDPATGRWISQDPIGFAAGDANLYRYVGNSPTNATDPSGLEQKATKRDISRARGILEAAGVNADTIKLRIGILTNSMKTQVGFGDYRSPLHWGVNSDNKYVSSNPLAAINDLWSGKRGSSKQKIQCNKYSKIIILKTYIDLAMPSQRLRMQAALANKSLPNDLPNGGDGLIFTREERGAPGFKIEDLLPGDQVWFINPFYDKLPANIANEERFEGEQGSNVFYLGDGMFMDIYTGNKKSLAEMQRYVHQYNCSSWAKFDAANYPILVRNTPLPNPF